MDLPHVMNLVIGDWSDDGHGKTDVNTISCSISNRALEKAYVKGTEIVGFDFSETVAVEWQDSSIPIEKVKRLEELGWINRLEDADEESYSIYTDMFLDIWMFIAKLGDPSLQWEKVKNSDVHIGGYGLFD
jgi:hypothetical protein